MFKRWPQKYINTLVHVYYLGMFQHVLGFQNDRFLNCYLQDCKYTRSSWEKYFNHSWVYGNFKTFFITKARVDWKQATTYLMAHCMYYVFNKFLQIPEMAQLLKIEFFRHNMAIACSTTLMKFHFHETLYSAVVYHRQNIISKYLDIFSKLLAKRKITRCLMGHMAHLTIFGFLFFHFFFHRSLNSGREGCTVRKKFQT